MFGSDLKELLKLSHPSARFNSIQLGLWHAAHGNWQDAHLIAQSKEGIKEFDLLHAYLHRVEGDLVNAAYWYRKAGAPECKTSFEEELDNIIELITKK